jgi:hypothetical protein
MANKLLKVSGAFKSVGDVVGLQVPTDAAEVALRLYEPTQEIAIWFVRDAVTPVANTLERAFMAIALDSDLPVNYVKFIGALGLMQPGSSTASPIFQEVHIIEVTPTA